MSSNNEINFGPVFMRGRKPVTGNKVPTAHPPNNETASQSQVLKNSGGPTPVVRPSIPSLGSFSSGSISPALPLSKSFSAVVSPEKENEERVAFLGASNGWDVSHGLHDASLHSTDFSGNAMANGTAPVFHEYSRETLLNLYSEVMALKLPPDLETSDPAFSDTLVGPPLGLIEMTEAEKELFSGPYNSDRRAQANKAQHHNHADSPTTPISHPDGNIAGLATNRLSVSTGAKLGKHHSPIERFTNLGIQGGVLAGVASPTHSTNRRRGDSENDPPEGTRRFPRPDEPALQSAGWSANPRDRRARDSGPPAEGKWKRGVPLEEKMHLTADIVSSGNPRYSVLDRMREKAAASLDQATKESTVQGSSPHEVSDNVELSRHLTPSEATKGLDGNLDDTSPPLPDTLTLKHESKSVTDASGAAASSRETDSSGAGQNPPAVSSHSLEAPPEDIAWQYRDPSGTIQGPFTAFQMQEWYKASFFRDDLLVKRVSDIAFETLETLILRIGDRDRPFLVRPPPVLPPNLPLPGSHTQSFQGIAQAHSSPMTQRSSLLEQPSFPTRQDTISVFDSPIVTHNHDSNSLHPSSAPDPWNSSAQSMSPLHRSATLPSASPLVTASGWHVGLPALSGPPAQSANDYNASLLGNGYAPNSFGDPMRFLQHVPHPALVGGNNGYPFTHPIPHQPAFGQIPVGHHLFNGANIDPHVASQLHPHLEYQAASYRGNTSMGNNADLNEPPTEHERNEQLPFTQTPGSLDPWHMQPDRVASVQTQVPDQNLAQPTMSASAGHADPTSPTHRDSWTHPLATIEPIGTRSSGKNTPISASRDLVSVATLPNQHSTGALHASPVEAQNPVTLPEAASAPPAISSGSVQSPASRPSDNKKQSIVVEDKRDTSSPQSQPLEQRSSVQSLEQRTTSQAEAALASDEPWQSVSHQSATKSSLPPTGVATPAIAPAPKQSGKVIVISRAQQDEHDRRTASIQKTQLQLKEAQAVERAAREASEAAAAAASAAVTASISAPAPWSKEDSKTPTSNLSLMEIQAIESKQAEKRRQAEKQAAANRALAEQAAAAERAAKAMKESLPPTSNWATASSPTKHHSQLGSPVVWGGKDNEGTINSAPKQTMKQIQEEEARRKKLAQQQLATKAASIGSTRSSAGYAGSIGAVATKAAAVSGPWSVVGAKSKVIAPPVNGARPVTSVVPGLPSTGRLSTSAQHSTLSKTPMSSTRTIASMTNNSNKAVTTSSTGTSTSAPEGPPPASAEFMKWLREALRGMNNVDDFMKMLLDFPINPDESVLEIVSDSVYAGSATLDGRRFAKEFNTRRHADVMARMGNSKPTPTRANSNVSATVKKTSTMADALKSQPAPKNDGWGFAVVGPKKKKK
ncbi:uncharacterized protein MELLADRAFT_78488 [Melampsora larici-populina 98AG31]|uniref:GYF domain-containing protein n=1 Tax=Melampsora larici-populina (strain 98AG31 / pathotype 3-4-7) TaxID=747676 RepID=F4RUZ3_MELLP|nr:uncharacterized protein MELLADRAFT_78488 [Melampsora larici-populina 98AG31]EGG03780.1 hypothetical protein MELLADRAFT_78488 [Melampsora larici-populina 98AG31]